MFSLFHCVGGDRAWRVSGNRLDGGKVTLTYFIFPNITFYDVITCCFTVYSRYMARNVANEYGNFVVTVVL